MDLHIHPFTAAVLACCVTYWATHKAIAGPSPFVRLWGLLFAKQPQQQAHRATQQAQQQAQAQRAQQTKQAKAKPTVGKPRLPKQKPSRA